jgi:predicted house-cleaning noncanonical NTP pyrophosphatase (MazG superfamily)
MSIQYNKLVRDLIPEIIESEGKSCTTRVLSDAEYRTRLRDKLAEEIQEFDESGSVEELVDIVEIILALADLQGVDGTQLEARRLAKRAERGGFERRLLLIDAER